MTKSDLQSIIGAKTVSFNSLFAKATGSVTAAVFLSQAVFWQEKAKFKGSIETAEFDGERYFSKTAAEWWDETGLSAEQQKTARKPLVSSGILKEKRAGLPAKMYFRIDIEALVSGISAYLNTGDTVSGFSANRKPENPRTLHGKFRKQEAGKPASNIRKESLNESLESEEERAASPFHLPENENQTFGEEKEKTPPPNSAPPPPLIPPFTPTGETIEPKPATLVRLYDPQVPAVTIVDSVPGEYRPATPYKRVNIGEEITRLKTDELAKETFALVRKIPSNLFSEYVEAFEKEIGGTGETYPNQPAFRKHFFNWSGTRYEISQRKATIQNGKRSSLNAAGGDLSKYEEKQRF